MEETLRVQRSERGIQLGVFLLNRSFTVYERLAGHGECTQRYIVDCSRLSSQSKKTVHALNSGLGFSVAYV